MGEAEGVLVAAALPEAAAVDPAVVEDVADAAPVDAVDAEQSADASPVPGAKLDKGGRWRLNGRYIKIA